MSLNGRFETQSLSNRQSSFLHEAVEAGGLTLERMLGISQTTAGSVVRRGLLKWDRESDRFQITAQGLDLLQHFETTDIGRKSMYRPFSSFIHNRELESRTKDMRERFYEQAKAEKARDEKRESKSKRKGR